MLPIFNNVFLLSGRPRIARGGTERLPASPARGRSTPMKSRLPTFALLIVALALVAAPLLASDPVGAYTLVERVVTEPAGANPTTVQIWGAFSFAVPRSNNGVQSMPAGGFGDAAAGDVYGPVARGFLFYTCQAGRETTCRNEWSDLRKVAGTRQIVGFGGRHLSNGTVRTSADRPGTPDVYPLNVGVVRIGTYVISYGAPGVPNRTQYPELIAALGAALRTK